MIRFFLGIVLVSIGCSSGNTSRDAQRDVAKGTMIYVIPAAMKRIGTIDERFQSYNVEMLEVTGGKFWKPYGPELDALLLKGQQAAATAPEGGDTPAGMNPALYQYRPPIDLANPRLRNLAKGLAPAYVRVSGTWANSTYFPNSDQAPKSPPAGPTMILSFTTSGATVMAYPASGRAPSTVTFQIGRPLFVSIASRCPSIVPMKSESPRIARPRLTRPQHGLA